MSNSTSSPTVAASPAQQKNAAKPKTPPHVRIPIAFIEKYAPLIGPSAFLVYVALVRRNGHNGNCIPSHECLAADTGLSVATIKRALKTLKDNGLVGWAHRREQTRRKGKLRQTSNHYFLKQIELPSQPKKSADPEPNLSDETIQGEGVTPQPSGVAVDGEKAIASPGEETATPSYSAKELEQWRALFVEMRCTPEEAERYMGPHVPRVAAWWATVDKLRYGKGLLITRLQNPSLLPAEPEQQPAPRTWAAGGAYKQWGETEAPPADPRSVEEQAIEQCLAGLDEKRRSYIEVCRANEKLSTLQILQRECNWEYMTAYRRIAQASRAH